MRTFRAALIRAAGILLLAVSGALRAQILDRPSPPPVPNPKLPPAPQTNREAESYRMPTPGGPEASRKPEPLPAGRPKSGDGATIDAILDALYESASRADGGEPNWSRMREIFVPGARIIPPGRSDGDPIAVLDLEGLRRRVVEGGIAAKARGENTGFHESESARRLDCFGNVCQVFSTYEARRSPSDAKPFVRGINAIQLLHDGRRWWVASLTWDAERPDNPIPAEYRVSPLS